MFGDRLVDELARQKFVSILSSVLKTDWNFEWSRQEAEKTVYTSVQSQDSDGFGDHLIDRMTYDDFRTLVAESLTVFEREFKPLGILVVREAVELVVRISHVLSSSGGCLFLIGRCGVGRRSLVSLVCHMLRLELMTPMIGKNYGRKEYQEDLKKVMSLTGIQGQELVFMLEDFQLTDSFFLECANSLLSSGEVPGLYSKEELDQVLLPLKEILAAESGFFGSLHSFFVSRVRKNLHVVVSMDPSNESFLLNCQWNPALFSRCSVQWVGQWKRDTLRQVASLRLRDAFEGLLERTDFETFVSKAVSVHEAAAARLGASPRDFVTLLDSSVKVLGEKRQELEEDLKRLRLGLGKLEDAERHVDDLAKEASVKKKQLAEKQEEADAALSEISESMNTAAVERQSAEGLRSKLASDEVIIQRNKISIEQ